MTHPTRFREDDPYLSRLREIAMRFPEAKERVSHGRPIFCTVKVFAQFGASLKGDHRAPDAAQSVVVLPDPDERDALLADERFFVPAYVGPSGWVGLRFRPEQPDWAEVAELLDMSYRRTAPRRLVALLDS